MDALLHLQKMFLLILKLAFQCGCVYVAIPIHVTTCVKRDAVLYEHLQI